MSDPLQTAPLVPGVDVLETLGADRWRVRVRLPLGLFRPTLNVELERTEEKPPEYAVHRAVGKGLGVTMQVESTFTLTGDDQATHVAWSADIAVGGRLGTLGERVLRPLVEHQVVGTLKRLEAQLAANSDEA
jgi:carbon monoxide dehydrogenase subunit G